MDLSEHAFLPYIDPIHAVAADPRKRRDACSQLCAVASGARQPAFLMGLSGEIIHANDAAHALLRATKVVQVHQGKLELPQPALDEMLRRCRDLGRAMTAAGAGAREGAEAPGRFHSLRITDRSESVYAFYAVLSPQRGMGACGPRPVVMLLFYHPDSAPRVDASLLCAMFGLTPVECRIAIQLAEGLSLKRIATAQGTQHDTVRKQLRSIFQKTATNRQPELIRLLLHLPQSSSQESAAGAAR